MSPSTARTASFRSPRSAGLPSAQWYIGLSIDKDKAYAALSQFRTSAIIAMLIAVAAIAGLLGLLIPVLMSPLTTMGRAMQTSPKAKAT
jgi:methyl-accepting chemotaxis protein